jgi:MFS family permease
MAIITAIIKNYFSNYTGLPRSCWQGIFLNFIESALAAVYYFLSIYFVDILHINISTAGIIISFYGLGTILGGFVGGKMSDKISPRIVSMASLLGQAITFLALIKIKNPIFIAVDLFILGIATYGFITSNYVFVLSYCKNSEADRLKAINILNIVSNLGIGLAALIIGELAANDFQNVFYLSGIFLLILAILLALQQNRLTYIDNKKDNDKIIINSTNIERVTFKGSNRAVNLALVCLFFTGMIVSQLSTTYSIYLKETFPQFGIHAFSLFFFLNTCLVVIFQNYLVNKFSDNNKLMMIGIGSFLIGFGMLLLNFSFIFAIALLSCIVYSAGEMIFFSMVQLFCYQRGNEGRKGSSLGAYRMVYASSRFIGPAVGGSIYYNLGGNVMWYFSGLTGLIFFILCSHYKKLA